MNMEQNGIPTFYATIEIKDIIRNIMETNANEIDFYDYDNIFEKGLVDSLDALSICMDLELKFGLVFNESDEMNISKNCSLDNIFLVLTQYIKPSDK